MSPTILRHKNYRFFFFSRVVGPDGEAKYWIEPIVSLDCYFGLSTKQLKELQAIVEENKDEIKKKMEKALQVILKYKISQSLAFGFLSKTKNIFFLLSYFRGSRMQKYLMFKMYN